MANSTSAPGVAITRAAVKTYESMRFTIPKQGRDEWSLFVSIASLMKTSFVDDINSRILSHSLRDGRLTMVQLGELIRLSTPAVQRRVKRLYDEHVLLGFRAEVDLRSIGQGSELWSVQRSVQPIHKACWHLKPRSPPFPKMPTVTECSASLIADARSNDDEIVKRSSTAPLETTLDRPRAPC